VISRVHGFLFSIQTKLMLAFTAVIVLVIFIAGFVFVLQTRDERRQQALDHVAAASPAIYQQALYVVFAPRPFGEDTRSLVVRAFPEKLDALSREQDVRILLTAVDGTILHDTAGELEGSQITYPKASGDDLGRGYVSWRPGSELPEANLTLVSSPGNLLAAGEDLPFNIVLAVETDNIAEAWVGILPSLALAALVAVPLALVVATLIARQVAQPVRKLTLASEAMARGDFDQRVEHDRDDEMGRLARSFTVMAERVGERDAQMRALLANVSHDLKTPMTSITGYAQALSDGTAGPDDAQHIGQVIREEAEHVNELLSDLLYLGEIDAGQVLTRSVDVPLDAVVERCVRRIESSVRSKEIAMEVEVEPDAVVRGVDPDKLERALTNVLENAAKFTPARGVIEVRGWTENGVAPARIQCAVTNSGSSIPEEDLPHVFDRFFRGDRARRTSSGSGLGLAIARELVSLNHGSIAARNDGPGVTFVISLPG